MNPILCITAAFLGVLPLFSVIASHAPDRVGEATIDYTRHFDFVSKFNGESYRVKVYVPQGTPPASGYPTLYVLDGNVFFGTFASAVWNEAKALELEQAVVVGIESGPGPNSADRTLDFTPEDLTAYEKKVVVDLGPDAKFGGYEKFIDTIQREIKPRVRHMVPVDAKHQTLLGWSLGGQAVVHTMLKHPDYFTCYVAISPALWRSDRAVFREVPTFEKTVSAGSPHVSLFMGVGSREEELTEGMKKWPVDQHAFAAEVKYARMVGNVRDFTALVKPFFDQHGMVLETWVFDGQTHNTVPWTALNPVLAFVLPVGHPK
ncbi:hypothetical protein KPL74_08475 [Bacillus sp. NP157]|nr:hypothetical protein KPL74_08475 [Bacillus sp. NP157]